MKIKSTINNFLNLVLGLIIFLMFEPVYSNTPQKIISLAPSLTKNLYLLDAADLLVGCTNYCSLQSETDAEIIASAVQVNYEKAILLKADLIITTDLTKNKTIETFKKLGIEVLVFKNPENFIEISEQFISLGAKIGKREIAEKIIFEQQTRIDSIRSKIPVQKRNKKLFMQIGANPLWTVVPDMFMNDLIVFSSCENLASDLSFGSINLESVLLRNPDIIIVVLMGSMGEEEKFKWDKFSNLNAVKNKKIFTLGADNACSPTPVSFVDALEELTQLLYPDSK